MLTRSLRKANYHTYKRLYLTGHHHERGLLVSILIRQGLTHWIDSVTPKLCQNYFWVNCIKMFGGRAAYVKIELICNEGILKVQCLVYVSHCFELKNTRKFQQALDHCTLGYYKGN